MTILKGGGKEAIPKNQSRSRPKAGSKPVLCDQTLKISGETRKCWKKVTCTLLVSLRGLRLGHHDTPGTTKKHSSAMKLPRLTTPAWPCQGPDTRGPLLSFSNEQRMLRELQDAFFPTPSKPVSGDWLKRVWLGASCDNRVVSELPAVAGDPCQPFLCDLLR